MRKCQWFALLIWTMVASTLTIIFLTSYKWISLPELGKRTSNLLPKKELDKSTLGSSESDKLGDIVQRRLRYLQNPKDCRDAKKLVCVTEVKSGYGSMMHHVTMCLMVAYATERTLILRSKDWIYSPGGWETFFQPLSLRCNTTYGEKEIAWGSNKTFKSAKVVTFPRFYLIKSVPGYLMSSIPRDLATRLLKLPNDPFAWWVGQFVDYATRPKRHLKDFFNKKEKELGFTHPIVGVHVRRTDKAPEAKYYPLNVYMNQVAEFYKALEQQRDIHERRVYLATEVPAVLEEAKTRYPEYLFVNDYNATISAYDRRLRYTPSSLEGIILDIELLSKSDYLVCTLSSNVCRAAFEKMHIIREDPPNQIYSLDSVYFLADKEFTMTAIQHHKPEHRGEIEIRAGDQIRVRLHDITYTKHGYVSGLNLRTNMTGLYPPHKVKKNCPIIDLPTYPEV